MMSTKPFFVFLSSLIAFIASAQYSGTLQVKVTNQSGGLPLPAQGLAVFYFDDRAHNYSIQSLKPEDHDQWKYTNTMGEVSFSYSNKAKNDTLAWAAFNCSGSFIMGGIIETQNNQGIMNFSLNCLPAPCDAYTHAELDTSKRVLNAYAITLIDSTYTGGFLGPQIHEWSINGNTPVHGQSISQLNTSGGIGYCYKAYNTCPVICDSATITSSSSSVPVSCRALFMVDTLTPINHLGEIIILENSSVVAPAQIVNYHWSFGDGNSSSTQYPTHIYADTGVYEICLTITAANGSDTCISAHYDSIGFDVHGNLVHKSTSGNGFTINVVDPATVGVSDNSLPRISIYPNPTHKKKIYFKTTGNAGIQNVQLIDSNGALVKSFETTEPEIVLDDIPAGHYLLKIQTEDQMISFHRLVIQ